MDGCIFCKIIKKEIESKILYEDNYTICILDINPISDGHCIIFPKKHWSFFSECDEKSLKNTIVTAKKIANLINSSLLGNNGMNYLINEKEIAGQEIMHFHMHLIPKFNKNDGFNILIKNKKIKKIDETLKLIKSSIVF